jgi:hypothetical protein
MSGCTSREYGTGSIETLEPARKTKITAVTVGSMYGKKKSCTRD